MSEFRRYFLPTAFVFVCVWLLCWVVTYQLEPASERRGQFGDMFGSVNALFSGLAFAGVVCALILQSREIHEQSRDQKTTQATLQKQADALLLSARIQALTYFIQRDEPLLAETLTTLKALREHSGRIHSPEQPQQARDVFNANVKMQQTRSETLSARLETHRTRLEELYAHAEKLSNVA